MTSSPPLVLRFETLASGGCTLNARDINQYDKEPPPMSDTKIEKASDFLKSK